MRIRHHDSNVVVLVFIKYAQYFQKTIVTLPIGTLTTRSRAEVGKFSGSAASPDSRLRLVFSPTFSSSSNKVLKSAITHVSDTVTV